MKSTTIEKSLKSADLLVVGCGFFGTTIAERVANDLGKKVIVIDKRSHIGGNAYSYIDASTGIEIHKYGTHIFHTSNEKIWNYVNQFTSFNNYTHKVYSISSGRIFTLPFNLSTFAEIYQKYIPPSEIRELINSETSLNPNEKHENLRDKAISQVGAKIYEALIENYTFKQWQKDPKELPAEIISRLPIRMNFNNRYFNDTYEGLPLGGYYNWVNEMLNSKNIEVFLNTDYFDIKNDWRGITVYTGPIDKYFNYVFGQLNWRTLEFEFETLSTDNFQGNSVINYSDLSVPFTRIHEFKHLHPERNETKSTIIAREYSKIASRNDEPYYPVNTLEDKRMLNLYRKKLMHEKKIIFGGRLGTYKYLDMHMAIGSALSVYENSLRKLLINE